VRKVIRTWQQLKDITFYAWVRYVKDAKKKRLTEWRMKCWKAKILMQKWAFVIEDLNRIRELGPKAENFSSLNRKKRYFRSWRKATKFSQKFAIKTKKMREIALASSIINILWYKMIARKILLLRWKDAELLNRQQ
jgi:hypothetical protein